MPIIRAQKPVSITVPIGLIASGTSRAVRIQTIIYTFSTNTPAPSVTDYSLARINRNIHITKTILIADKAGITIPITLTEPNQGQAEARLTIGAFGTCNIITVIPQNTFSTLTFTSFVTGDRIEREGVTALSIEIVDVVPLACFTGSSKIMPFLIVTNSAEGLCLGWEEGSGWALLLGGSIDGAVIPENFWLYPAAEVIKFPEAYTKLTILILPTYHIITRQQLTFLIHTSFICFTLRIHSALRLLFGFRLCLAGSVHTLESIWTVNTQTSILRHTVTTNTHIPEWTTNPSTGAGTIVDTGSLIQTGFALEGVVVPV